MAVWPSYVSPLLSTGRCPCSRIAPVPAAPIHTSLSIHRTLPLRPNIFALCCSHSHFPFYSQDAATSAESLPCLLRPFTPLFLLTGRCHFGRISSPAAPIHTSLSVHRTMPCACCSHSHLPFYSQDAATSAESLRPLLLPCLMHLLRLPTRAAQAEAQVR